MHRFTIQHTTNTTSQYQCNSVKTTTPRKSILTSIGFYKTKLCYTWTKFTFTSLLHGVRSGYEIEINLEEPLSLVTDFNQSNRNKHIVYRNRTLEEEIYFLEFLGGFNVNFQGISRRSKANFQEVYTICIYIYTIYIIIYSTPILMTHDDKFWIKAIKYFFRVA